jgi:putative ABC transport system permease protein
MTIWRMVFKEIRLRWLNFGLGTLAVLAAVGVLVTELTLLEAHDLQTRQLLDAKLAETEAEMSRLEDDYRKLMKELGYNLLILPEGQDLGDFYAKGYAARTMPEEYVTRLANSKLMTIRHLLPSLEQKIRWPEQGQRNVILVGTRGEVPVTHRTPKEPMMMAVPPATAVLGHEICDSLNLKPNDRITLLGKQFEVKECYPERGTKDDVTIWIDLATAQEMLDQKGRINAILALECLCTGADYEIIERSVHQVLPNTEVIELKERVKTRAEARLRAKQAHLDAIQAEKNHEAAIHQNMGAFAARLIPLVSLGAAVWVGILALMNVRERKPEIGILRALGFRSRQIMIVFLSRALLIGFTGALLGFAGGLAISLLVHGARLEGATGSTLFDPGLLGLIIIVAPLMAALASWPPALLAAREDPAIILNEG